MQPCCYSGVKFPMRRADAVAIVLFETDLTWAGSLHRKKDTCAVKALAINAAGKKQPVLWASKRLPSDCFAVRAVPSGGVLVFSSSLIIFQNKVPPRLLPPPSPRPPGCGPLPLDGTRADGRRARTAMTHITASPVNSSAARLTPCVGAGVGRSECCSGVLWHACVVLCIAPCMPGHSMRVGWSSGTSFTDTE